MKRLARFAACLLILAAVASCGSQVHAQSCGRSYAGSYFNAHASCYAPAVIAPVAPANYNYSYPDYSFRVTYYIQASPPAATGATVYGPMGGYPGSYYQPVVGLDPTSYLNSASRYLELSQETARVGFDRFNQSATVMMQQNHDAAVWQAKAEIAKALASGSGSSSSITVGRALTPEESPPLRLPGGGVAGGVAGIVAAKCVSCHGPTKQEGGLRMDDMSKLDARMEREILKRIVTKGEGRMPKNGTLTDDEIFAFFAASSLCGNGAKK